MTPASSKAQHSQRKVRGIAKCTANARHPDQADGIRLMVKVSPVKDNGTVQSLVTR
jgi:hypothetical protein